MNRCPSPGRRQETIETASARWLLVTLLALAASLPAKAADYYWDSNSTTAGFGSTTGIWGTSAFWSTDPAGSATTALTTIGSTDTVNFGTATLNYSNAAVGVDLGGVSVNTIVFGAGQTTSINLGTAGSIITLGGTTPTITVNNTTAGQTISSILAGSAGLIKSGAGSLTLSGTAVNTFTGGLSVNGGTLVLNSSNLTTPTDLIHAANSLTLGGNSTLTFTGQNSTTNTFQTFAGTTLSSGVNTLNLTKGASATSINLTLGALTVSPGSATTIIPGAFTWAAGVTPTSEIIKISSFNGNALPVSGKVNVNAGLFYRTAAAAGSARWVSVDSTGQLQGLPAAVAPLTATTADPINAYQISTANLALTNTAASVYGLVLNASAASRTLTLAANGKLTLNGIINVQVLANTTSILPGTGTSNLIIGAERNLVINMDNTGGVTITAPIADNSIGASSVTIASTAPVGTTPGVVALGGANTYTGATNISNSVLSVNNVNALGGNSPGVNGTSAITMGNGATLRTSLTNAAMIVYAPITTTGNVTINAPTVNVATQTFNEFVLNGAIGGTGNVTFSNAIINSNTILTVTLKAQSNYTGTTTLDNTAGTSGQMFLKLGTNDALPTTTVLNILGQAGTGTGRGIGLNLFGFSQTLAGLTNTAAASRVQEIVNSDLSAAATLTINGSSNTTFSGNLGRTGVAFSLNPMTGSTNGNNFGLTKNGTGTFTLSAVNPYAGSTLISGGTLAISGAGAINGTSGITISGAGAKLLQTSSVAMTPTVTLTLGTLTGNGTVNTVNVGNGTGGTISNNNGVAGASLTIGALTFNGAATVNTFSSSPSAPIVTTTLETNAAGTVTLNPTAITWAANTPYDLISYTGGSIGGAGFGGFTLGTVTGASPRATRQLADSGTAITLTIGVADTPYWVGDGDGKWNLASTNNWKLLTAGTYTTFLSGDDVLFNDNATGAGPINVVIDAANVSTSTTTFDNSTKNYVLSGAFGISSGSLIKNGTGNVTINTVNTYTGPTTINLGQVTLGGTAVLGNGSALTMSGGKLDLGTTSQTFGAVSITAPAASGDTISNGSLTGTSYAASNMTGNAIISANLLLNGTAGFTMSGAGTTTLTGQNTYNGATTVSGGTLVAAGGSTSTGAIVVGNTAATNAVLNIPTGGTLTGGTSLTAGTVDGSFGAVNITGGALTTTADSDSSAFGGSNGGYGALTMSSGTMTQPRFMFGGIGASTTTGGIGVGLITGGTVNSNNWFILARNGASTGILTITGGTINHAGAANTISIGLSGTAAARAELNVAGGTIDNTGQRLTFSGGTGGTFHWSGTGIVNLNAGTLVTQSITYDSNALSANASSYINFNGGTLKASANSTIFLPAFTPTGTGTNRVFVNGAFGTFAGGAVIDSNFDITIGANLLAPSGNGVTALSLVSSGSGYIGAPAVQILDDGVLSTATAYAVVGIDPTNLATFGKVTSVVITNPGVINGTPTVNLIGGGGTGAAISVALTGPNTSGGLTKGGTGTGTLTLTGTNTYTGATIVNVGTLSLAGAGEINASSGITISGSSAKLLQISSVAISPTVTVTQGTLTGNTTVNTVNVGNATGGIISNNNGVAGTSLTIGDLTFNGAATVNTFSSTPSAPIVTTTLATNAAGTVTINPTATTWTINTPYDLISYTGGSIGGAGFGQFTLGTVTGASPRATRQLADSGTAITLTVGVADNPYWVGDGDGKWNLTSTNNWKLITAGTYTTFLVTDDVLFNDNATGAGPINVNIDAANVSPNSTLFDNSTKNYVLGGAFGIASGSLTKNGTGNVTINTVNTYTGPTTINLGQVTLGSTGVLGNGSALTLAGGKLDLGTTSQTFGAVSITAVAAVGDTISNGSLTGTSYAASNSTGNAIISANLLVNGTAGFTMSGTGTVTLSGVNTYTGNTTVTAGTVRLSGSGTLGATSSSVAVNAGALLDLNGTSQSIKFIAGSGVGTVANNSGVGTSILTLTANPGANVIIQDNTNGSTGKVAVVVAVTTQPLNNLNTYSGGTTVNAGAFLYLISTTPLGAGTGPITLTAFGGTGATSSGLVLDGVTYPNDITGAGYFHINSATTPILTGNITTSGPLIFRSGTAGAYNFAGNGTTSLLSGVIGSTTSLVNGAVATGSVIKSGTGTLTLTGANLYTGTTTIENGMLKVGSAGALGNGTSAIVFGNAASITNNLSPTLLIDGTFTVARNITVGADATTTTGVYTIGGSSANVATFSGNQTLNQSLTVTQVTGGTLNLTGNITSGSSGTQTLTIDNVGTVSQSTGVIGDGAGTIALTKLNTGTLTLSGANTYTGGTILITGILAANTPGPNSATGSVAVTVTGGKLIGTGNIAGAITLNGGIIAPGDATNSGILTTATTPILMSGGFTFNLSGGQVDSSQFKINDVGTLDLGSLLTLNVTPYTGGANPDHFTLIASGASSVTGTFVGLPEGAIVFSNLGQNYIINYGTFSGEPGNVVLAMTAVPEPTAVILIGFAVLAGMRRRNR
ncbi:hypothetical protein BH11PLA2_BH11PLA2_10360 [soil metagenome]